MISRPDYRAHIASVATAFPSTVVNQDDAIDVLTRLFPDEREGRIDSIVRRSGIERRYISPSLDEVLLPGDFSQRNSTYHNAALRLAESACRDAIDLSGLDPEQIDVLIDVSCTGIAIPALDVSLTPLLGLRSDVRRIPISESGCAAGALGLNVAHSLAEAGKTVLLVAVELCSLSMCRGDRSRTSLIASILFGDGAAAVVIRPEGPGISIESVRSHLIPNTRDVMGFDIGSHGMRIILERELPRIVSTELPLAVEKFLADCDRTADDLDLHLVHPGGRKILEAYEENFCLGAQGLTYSRDVLSNYGNLSSASILTVLERACYDDTVEEGSEALLVAIGPGLSIEMALLNFGTGVVQSKNTQEALS